MHIKDVIELEKRTNPNFDIDEFFRKDICPECGYYKSHIRGCQQISKSMKIIDFLKGKFKYDNYGQFIWLVQPNGNHQKIADLRGWGAIQNLFKQKSGKIDMDKAAKFQDELGQWVADTLNEKLNIK